LITDNEGFAIPFVDDDPIIEAGLDDPDYGPPETWPNWTDLDRWSSVPPTEAEDDE
jgi:hypothetical protein